MEVHMTAEPLPTPFDIQYAGKTVLARAAALAAEVKLGFGPAVDHAKKCGVTEAEIWEICANIGLTPADVLGLLDRPGPSKCVCGGLRVEHPRGGASIVAGSACEKFEAPK
jgi:hypothetical protein